MFRSLPALAALVTLALLTTPLGCGSEPESPESQIRRLLKDIERASREKDVAALKALVSERYADAEGRTQRDISGILTYHYLRRRDVYLLTRIESLEFPTPGSASLSVLGALAGTPIESPDSIRSLRADVYRFDLGLEDEGDGEWRVVRGAWRPAQLDDFM